MPFTFEKTVIPGVVIVKPTVYPDSRGAYLETYKESAFLAAGIPRFVQDSHSISRKGVLRGMHYQLAPRAQGKLVRVTKGAAFDVAVDLRSGSPTYGKLFSVVLSEENRLMVFIPAGFAHGFLALEEGTELLYKMTEEYSPSHERGIRWDDPELKIPWPEGQDIIISDKDRALPSFKNSEKGFAFK